MEEKMKKECPECGSTNVIYEKDRDELVCQDCGAAFAELEPKAEKQLEKAKDQE